MTKAKIVFHIGTFCGIDAILAYCGVGKVNAALCAELMIESFSPDLIISAGTAGALDPSLNVFDTIISDSVFYHDMGMKFTSPTINLFISEPDFVRFVQNLKYYIESDLEMSWGEKYPIGILGGDVRIDFMHYQSCGEAKEKWEKRAKRINWDKIVVFSTDRNGFTEQVFLEWKKIRYPKVLFTSNKMFAEEKNTVFYPEYCSNDFVPDLIPKREFYKDGVVQSVINRLSE